MPLIVKDGIDIETKGSLELGGRNTYLDKKKVQVLSKYCYLYFTWELISAYTVEVV